FFARQLCLEPGHASLARASSRPPRPSSFPSSLYPRKPPVLVFPIGVGPSSALHGGPPAVRPAGWLGHGAPLKGIPTMPWPRTAAKPRALRCHVGPSGAAGTGTCGGTRHLAARAERFSSPSRQAVPD